MNIRRSDGSFEEQSEEDIRDLERRVDNLEDEVAYLKEMLERLEGHLDELEAKETK